MDEKQKNKLVKMEYKEQKKKPKEKNIPLSRNWKSLKTQKKRNGVKRTEQKKMKQKNGTRGMV